MASNSDNASKHPKPHPEEDVVDDEVEEVEYASGSADRGLFEEEPVEMGFRDDGPTAVLGHSALDDNVFFDDAVVRGGDRSYMAVDTRPMAFAADFAFGDDAHLDMAPELHTMPAVDHTGVALEPYAGAFNSATTHYTNSLKVAEVVSLLDALLSHCEMPHHYNTEKKKYKVAAYYPCGYAKFNIRIWRRQTPGHMAVEVNRDQGERVVVNRFFDQLAASLTNKSVPDGVFEYAMFDWAPRKIPASLSVAPPSDDSVRAGIDAVTDMVMSCFDDVAVNGCSAVAKLAAASELTCRNMARHAGLVQALFDVVMGELSVETMTNAALALHTIVNEVEGQQTLLLTKPGALAQLAATAQFPALSPEAEYEVLALRRYCLDIVAVLLSSAHAAVTTAVAAGPVRSEVQRAAREAAACDAYPPLKNAAEAVIDHLRRM